MTNLNACKNMLLKAVSGESNGSEILDSKPYKNLEPSEKRLFNNLYCTVFKIPSVKLHEVTLIKG